MSFHDFMDREVSLIIFAINDFSATSHKLLTAYHNYFINNTSST